MGRSLADLPWQLWLFEVSQPRSATSEGAVGGILSASAGALVLGEGGLTQLSMTAVGVSVRFLYPHVRSGVLASHKDSGSPHQWPHRPGSRG